MARPLLTLSAFAFGAAAGVAALVVRPLGAAAVAIAAIALVFVVVQGLRDAEVAAEAVRRERDR